MSSMDNSNISTRLYRNLSTAFGNPTIHTQEYPVWMGIDLVIIKIF